MPVPKAYDPEFLRARISVVPAGVIYENDFIHDILGNLFVSFFESFSGVVGGHDDRDFFLQRFMHGSTFFEKENVSNPGAPVRSGCLGAGFEF